MARVTFSIVPPPPALLPSGIAFGGMLGLGADCAKAMKTRSTGSGDLLSIKQATKYNCVHGEMVRASCRRLQPLICALLLPLQYVSLSTNPMDSYFSVKINTLTLKDLINWFTLGNGDKLPLDKYEDMLATTGFPAGIAMSYAMQEVDLPGGGQIPSGIAFTGMLDLFGYSAFLKLEVDPKAAKFFGLCEVDPINWGYLALTRSATDSARGPIFKVDISVAKRTLEFDLEGNLKIWGVSAYAKLQVIVPCRKCFWPAWSFEDLLNLPCADAPVFTGEHFHRVSGTFLWNASSVMHSFMYYTGCSCQCCCRVSLEASNLPFGKNFNAKQFNKSKFQFKMQLMGPALRMIKSMAKSFIKQITDGIKSLTAGSDTASSSDMIAELGMSEGQATAVADWYAQYADLGEGEFIECISTDCREDRHALSLGDRLGEAYAHSMTGQRKLLHTKKPHSGDDSIGESFGRRRRKRKQENEGSTKEDQEREPEEEGGAATKRGAGEKCKKNRQCKSGTCKGNAGGMRTGKCTAPAEETGKKAGGATCRQNDECESGTCSGNRMGMKAGKCSESTGGEEAHEYGGSEVAVKAEASLRRRSSTPLYHEKRFKAPCIIVSSYSKTRIALNVLHL